MSTNTRIEIFDRKNFDQCSLTETSGNMPLDLAYMHNHYGFDKEKITRKHLLHRIDFLMEELTEIKDALKESEYRNLSFYDLQEIGAKIVDGHIDLVVVALGTLDLIGIKTWLAWEQVYKANMSKVVGQNPNRPNSDGIDLVKPEGWKAPSHSNNTGNLVHILSQDIDSFPLKYNSTPDDNNIADITPAIKKARMDAFNRAAVKQHPQAGSSVELQQADYCIEQFLMEAFYKHTGVHPKRLSEYPMVSVNKAIETFKNLNFYSLPFESKISSDSSIMSNLIGTVSAEEAKYTRFAIEFIEKIPDLLRKKGFKYQSPNSSVKAADYYSRGGLDLHVFNITEKYLRLISLVDEGKATGNVDVTAILETLTDNASYSAIMAEWTVGLMDGQDTSKDLFGREL